MSERTVRAAGRLALGLAAGGWLVRAAWRLPTALGATRGRIRPYAASSPHFRAGRFHNTERSDAMIRGEERSALAALLRRGRTGRPGAQIPVCSPQAPPRADELAATWYGHSSVLVEIDGRRVLTDPVWGERVSPSEIVGPARLHPAPGTVAALPRLDAVVISHDHYDHLDRPTVRSLLVTQEAPFVVPIGVGAHLRKWGVPEARIVELDWGQSAGVGDLTFTCTEARHFSGRGLVRDITQWASWAIVGTDHSVFFGGDSGYGECFARIGAAFGPFDLTLLPIGAYGPYWPDIHMNPEEAVRAHRDLCGDAAAGVLLPVHWATFNLAFHPWEEPIERLLVAADRAGTAVAAPCPGDRVEFARLAERVRWWDSAAR